MEDSGPRDSAVSARRELAAEIRGLMDRLTHGGQSTADLDAALLHVTAARLAASASLEEPTSRFAAALEQSLIDGRIDSSTTGGSTSIAHHSHDGTSALLPGWSWEVDDDRAVGIVSFGRAHEGPPDIVHGGSLAMACDIAVGRLARHHDWWVFTRRIDIRYLHPCYLEEELRWIVTLRSQQGRLLKLRIEVHDARGRLTLTADVQLVHAEVERFRSRAEVLRQR